MSDVGRKASRNFSGTTDQVRLGAAIGFCMGGLVVAACLLIVSGLYSGSADSSYVSWMVGVSIGAAVAMTLLAFGFVRRWSPRLVQEQVDAADVFQKVSDLSAEGFFVKDLSGRYLMVNTETSRMFGLATSQLLGHDASVLVSGEELDAVVSSDVQVLKTGETITFDLTLTTVHGPRQFLATKRPLLNRQGETIGIIGVSRDMTTGRKNEEELRIASIAFETQQGIFVADREGRIVRANSECCRLIGRRSDEIVGQPQMLLYSRGSGTLLLEAVGKRVRRQGYWQGELLLKRKNAPDFAAWVTVSAVRDENGEISHSVHSFSDLTVYKAATRKIHRLAYYDSLTKLPNRSRLKELVVNAVERGRVDGDAGAVVLVDIDNFKHLNDTRGHTAGDQLLVEVANRLGEVAGPSDTVARLGGDEFALLLTGLATAEATRLARRYCERILNAVARPIDLEGGPYMTSVSLGISVFVGGRDDAGVVLRQADMAMNQAKQKKSGSYEFFEQNMELELKERNRVQADLQFATSNDQLTLYFQPQFDRDLGVVGAEALVRWHHPTRGVVGPASFIPIAEESGLILVVGKIVLERACAQLAQWQQQGWDLTVALNVSARQFRQVGFVKDVRSTLQEQGADPTKLKLELTESMVLEDIDGAIRRMRDLRSAGISFALDDFGTGYSSLSYLSRLPLDELKIDRSFVSSVLDDENHAVIAESIISLASALGLRVVAEGVETLDQFEYLRSRNCEVFQGYHLGRPIAGPDFANAWLSPRANKSAESAPQPSDDLSDDIEVIS